MRKNILSLIVIALVTFVGCDRIDVAEDLNGAGQTLVKIYNAGADPQNGVVFSINPDPTDFDLIVTEVRRDIPNSGELSKTLTVKLEESATVLTDYNTNAGTNYVPLTDNLYTVVTPGVTKNGTEWTVVFDPGEFAKQIKLRLKRSLFSFSSQYALALMVKDAGGANIHADLKSGVSAILLKNQWDGRYRITFTNYHPTLNPGYTGTTTDVEMHTSGANKVKIYFPLFGGYYCPAVLSGNLTAFGAQEPEYTIAANNSVTVQNSYPGAVTFYTMASGFNSRYEPGTKTFYAKWGYNYTAGAFNPASTREWTQTIVYVGPR